MGNFGGFYKGEKKKKKRGQEGGSSITSAPVFVPPKIVGKGKKEER